MGWTVIIEDEDGNAKRTMPEELILSDSVIFNNEKFRIIKYLDPFGDTTFNAFMYEDLIMVIFSQEALKLIKKYFPT